MCATPLYINPPLCIPKTTLLYIKLRLIGLLLAKLPHIGVVFLSVGRPPSPNPSLNLGPILRVILALILGVIL